MATKMLILNIATKEKKLMSYKQLMILNFQNYIKFMMQMISISLQWIFFLKILSMNNLSISIPGIENNKKILSKFKN